MENAVYSIKGVTCAFSTSVSTGPDGCALVEDLPAGVYVVKEESVPEPFVRTASEQTIALRPGKISEARFEDYTRPGLEIVKRNIADGSPIEGVTYQVRQIDGDFQDTVVTDSEGRAFLEVDPGSYMKFRRSTYHPTSLSVRSPDHLSGGGRHPDGALLQRGQTVAHGHQAEFHHTRSA